jgi:hypothetical protein
MKVSFGDSNYEDFTQHKDNKRKRNYISRHRSNEDWMASWFANTAGFYSRYVLWNKDTIEASIDDLNKKFKHKGIRFIYQP